MAAELLRFVKAVLGRHPLQRVVVNGAAALLPLDRSLQRHQLLACGAVTPTPLSLMLVVGEAVC